MNLEFDKEKYQLDPNKWLNTLPNYKKNNEEKSNKKYSLTVILFVVGLILVSLIKNETRNLQKEISDLTASIKTIKFNLYQETLEHEVITSPENISRLAEKYLESNYISYKKSQIKHFDGKQEILTKLKVNEQKNVNKKISKKIKLKLAKKIEQKKIELQELRDLSTRPKELPTEIRLRVTKKIEEKTNELKKLYSEPTDSFLSGKAGRWLVVQLVKVFLGMPIVPGR